MGHRDAPTQAQLDIKLGDWLDIKQDDGTVVTARARSAPWQVGGDTWVVAYEGRSGGYLLTRCTPHSEPGSTLKALVDRIHAAAFENVRDHNAHTISFGSADCIVTACSTLRDALSADGAATLDRDDAFRLAEALQRLASLHQ